MMSSGRAWLLLVLLMMFALNLGREQQVSATTTLTVDGNYSRCVSSPQSNPYGVVYCAIRDALEDAAPGAIIHLAAGTYIENLTLNKTVTLPGAGQSVTIINGNALGSVVRVKPGQAVAIAKVTITNGHNATGGGIFNDGGLLYLT